MEEKKMKLFCKIIAGLFFTVLLSAPAMATNGDNLIGVGPISRAMGGVGIAAPQDAISAVFANPAAMCFGPFCPSSQVDFAGTLFMPDVSASVTGAMGVPLTGDSGWPHSGSPDSGWITGKAIWTSRAFSPLRWQVHRPMAL